MNILKSFFPPGYPRNIWHLLLLISALFATLFTIVDLVLIPVLIPGDILFILRLMVGLVVLGSICLLKASGTVRYWASFLWLGLFLLFAGVIFVDLESYSIPHQLFLLLGNVLLLVFFWNLGNFDRRILAPLFLIFTPLSVIMFLTDSVWDIIDVRMNFGLTIGFIINFVFYSLFVIMAVNSVKLLKLPGFRWLFAGFSLFLLGWVVFPVGFYFFENNLELLEQLDAVFFFLMILFFTYPVLLTVGASIFTVKMDPLELEKRLRKATPAKEVESADQKV